MSEDTNTGERTGLGEARTGRFQKSSDEPGKTVGVVDRRGVEKELVFDEPEPIGEDEYPSPVTQMFGSLIACQMSVLGQCLEKANIDEFEMEAEASIDGRTKGTVDSEMPQKLAKRIDHITIDIILEVPEEYKSRADRCLDVYDTGCIVGQSFKAGIDYTPNTTLKTT